MKDIKIEDYLPFVKSIASKYRYSGLPYDDLVQEGMIGLWEAMQRYDPEKGAKLTTYAAYWIKKRIIDAINSEHKHHLNSSELNEDITAADEKYEYSENEEKLKLPDKMPELEKIVLSLSFEEQLTLNEIAEKLNITREKCRQLKEKGLRRLKSVLSPISLKNKSLI
ncbi:MAG: sigma-70 family RNA polymerase sigma factor [Candidatus Stygibacter australis]|nr:sigma-70 family RNA polymerase sigma factor [Candidatus Stygibacter australis]